MRTNSGVNVPNEVALLTAITLLFCELPAELEQVSVMVNDPAAAKAWLGFCMELVPPSPKSHDQELGLPVEASVKTTGWLAVGVAVDTVKAAAGIDEPDVPDEADPPPPPPQPGKAKVTSTTSKRNNLFLPDMIDLLFCLPG